MVEQWPNPRGHMDREHVVSAGLIFLDPEQARANAAATNCTRGTFVVGGGGVMDQNLIMLGLFGWGLVLLVGLVFMRISGDQDRAARRAEKRLIPQSHVTNTQYATG